MQYTVQINFNTDNHYMSFTLGKEALDKLTEAFLNKEVHTLNGEDSVYLVNPDNVCLMQITPIST